MVGLVATGRTGRAITKISEIIRRIPVGHVLRRKGASCGRNVIQAPVTEGGARRIEGSSRIKTRDLVPDGGADQLSGGGSLPPSQL